MPDLKLLSKATEEFKDDLLPIIHAVSLNELLKLNLPPLLNLLNPWLHEGSITLIYAERGVGKTYFCLEVTMAVASAGSFLSYNAPRAAKVLYIDGEMTANTLQSRLRVIKERFSTNNSNFIEPVFITPDLQDGYMPDISTSEGREALKPYTDEAELIIVDNISTLCGSIKESDGDDWGPIQRWALNLRSKGKSIIFVHHAGKSGGQRGTSRREDIVDNVIKLQHPNNYEPSMNACFEIHFEKSRRIFGDDVNAIICRFNEGTWTFEPVKEADYNNVIELAKEGMLQKDIAAQLGISKGWVSKLIKKAKQSGEL